MIIFEKLFLRLDTEELKKDDEYLTNPTSIFLEEIRFNEISTKLPLKDEKYDKIVENNLKRLCLN